uniref:non-specific serine/threonine protein kinase n=1 Tax=Eubacterium cellulosolvens (strain ATCC 43171 / JCM 9499 / 6) TaxID=633697 RepID=I5AV86_EUBC6
MLKEGVILSERYEIMSRIGAGGMADVYKAQDRKLNRLVAVKVMKAEFREDTSFVQKFQKEAQAAAKLSHPNVVNVYDVGEDRGLYFIVMELIEGITLKNYIGKKGKLSVKEATSIAIQVSLGLEAAHNCGIVHRDVKPQNIIISTDGKVKLSDFGIAKAINSNTITANVMGSVHYSSPEQVRGGISDAKSDIYSLGITMYEMVTGRVPFDGDTTVSIAIKHLQEEIVPPSIYTPDLPYSLEQVILKCTQKNPDRRYQNVGELIDDLKKSLIDPQGNFVAISPLASHAETANMSDREMSEIRRGMDMKERRAADERRHEEEYQRERERERRRDYDNEEDDDDEEESTGLEKAVTIGGFIVGAIIILILIVVIGNMAGLFHFGKSANATSSSKSTSATSENTIEVPDLRGKTIEEATKIANDKGIGVKQTSVEASDQYPEGQIISQDPDVGSRVEKGTTINVVVSGGQANITIPSGIVGMSRADAEATLQNIGLVTSVQEQYNTEVPEGTVISIEPGEGTSVATGETVVLYVSKGEENDDVILQDLIGKSSDEAKSILETQGLNYSVQTGNDANYENGAVIAMDPGAGQTVKKGDTITITINGTGDGSSAGDGYICYSPLSQPQGYQGGTVKLELVQGDLVSVIYEGDNPWSGGAYSTPIESTSGEEGVINVYENDLLIAKYPSVTFQKK